MTKQWQRMRKKDDYYKQAKAHGYRSRAAYKLKQINNKFKIFRRGDKVLDLGAAPGGWSQVAVELVGETGDVLGIDLESISSIEHATFVIGDITDKDLIEAIFEHFNNAKINIVMSDAAPNISGNYSVDQARSVYIAQAALNIAQKCLTLGGNFIVKVFEGEDFKEFLDSVKDDFHKARIYSPKASRARSSEVYVIGIGFKK
jgi:23S rRNA (uridine2552-2'-O)-methyltransferase